eukprot:scaffold1559_cov193-Alexandrium_tamarense.AAC.28
MKFITLDGTYETQQTILPTYSSRIVDSEPLPQYTLEDALKTADMYTHLFAIVVYDPEEDKFSILSSNNHYWGNRGRWVCDTSRNTFSQRIFLHSFRSTIAL